MVDTSHLVHPLVSSYQIRLRAKALKWNKNKILSQCDGIFSPSSHHKCEIFSKALHLRRGDESIY